MKRTVCILTICLLLLIGCTSFSGIKPYYPKVGDPNYPTKVDSLQPTFKWKSSPGAEAYDFIIYECIVTKDIWETTMRTVGREVYYREGLKETQHSIEEPLKPKCEYYWSVRIRQGQKVSDWSLYNYYLYMGVADVSGNNLPFSFQTPEM